MSDPELRAVESALNTLALAESETALQKVVLRFLPAVLSALSTKSDAARAKCIETLQHINVRVRANPHLKLPFAEVLDVATRSDAAILTANVAIQGGYLTRCFERLTRAEKAETLRPLVKSAIIVTSQSNQDTLGFLSLQALSALAAERPKSTSTHLWEALSSCPDRAVSSFFNYSLRALNMKLKISIPEPALVAIVRVATEYAGIKQPERAARVFPHFLVAAGSSSRSALMAAGEDALKKVDTCDVLAAADPSIVGKLFDLFCDQVADIPLRIVVLSKGLLTVPLCASCFPEVLQVIKLSLHTPGIPSRFQTLGMQFVSFVIKHSDQLVLEENTASLIDLMMQLALNETHGSPSFSDAVRAFGFTGLGELIIRVPSLMGTKRLTAQFFFSSAQSKEEPVAVRSSASHTLIAIARVLKFDARSAPELHASVIGTLTKTLENSDDLTVSARAAVVHWANECFPFSDPSARLLNIIASADPKQGVRQEAIAGLSPKRWSFKDGKVGHEPDTVTKASKLSVTAIVDAFSSYDAKQPSMVEAYLTFAFSVLIREIIPGGKFELVNINTIDRVFEENSSIKKSLVHLTREAEDVLFGRVEGKSSNIEKAALSVILFTSKLTSLRQECSKRYSNRINDLIKLATRKSASGDIVVAHAIASLVGCASIALSADDTTKLFNEFGSKLEPHPSGVPSSRDGEDERVATVLCLGQVILCCRQRKDIVLEECEASPLSTACLNMSRRVLLPVESTNVVRVATCMAFADIGVSAKLPMSQSARENFVASLSGILRSHNTDSKLTQVAADTIGKICIGEPSPSFKKTGMETLLHLSKERKEDEIRFVAAESLVRCVSGFDAPSPAALEGDESNNDDSLDMSVSETLQNVLRLRTEPFEVRDTTMVVPSNASDGFNLESAFNGVIALAHDERPTARAGGCVCLVTFLRLLGRQTSDVSETVAVIPFRTAEDESRFIERQRYLLHHLEEIQRAFTTLLGDRSEFVQQMASCGVALAYRMCPPSQQSDLVSALVRSLTSGKIKSAATVPGDQGTLLELGGVDVKDDSKVPKSATYKELCTLAQDMGQPELVYKFMDLAGHAALWNNRKGAALAGSALLGGKLAAEQLRPHVKSLLPRLYVYCYDPTDSVRIAMGSVLGAVIKASGLSSVYEAVSEHFDIVVQYCLKSMTSRQWRSREAGCAALRDALSSRTWEQVQNHLSDFWYYTIRAMDDIKETVRKAAAGTGRALSELSTHLCDPDQTGVIIAREAATVVISAVMPGIMHADEAVRSLCGTTMTKLIRYGGTALRGSVADLVGMLLEAATEMESQALNYLQFHVNDPNALEEARVNAASTSTSPLVDALERVSGLVDETNVEDTVRTMIRLAKVGVGIPTRAGTARFFSTVLKSRAAVIQPFASKLLSSAVAAAGMETNAALRHAWCAAAGTAAKQCAVPDVAQFVDRIVMYAGSEDSRERLQASCLAVGLWRESPDTARQHASALLPIAYMGSYETDDETSTAGANWREVWSDGAPSTEAALRLYTKEITDICERRLKTSSQYRVKRSASAALGALAEAANDSVDVKCMCRGTSALVSVIPGHIWDGKIVAIEAIGIIAENFSSSDVWSEVNGADAVIRLLLRESKRGKKEYKVTAIDAAHKLLVACRGEYDLFDEVFGELREHWTENNANVGNVEEDGVLADVSRVVWETGSDANAVDARNKARKARRQLRVNSVRCLESAYVGSRGERYTAHYDTEQAAKLSQLMEVFKVVVKGDWDGRLEVMKSLKRAMERSKWESLFGKVTADSVELHDRACGDQTGRDAVQIAMHGMTDWKFSTVRCAAYDCIGQIGRLAPDLSTGVRGLGREACQMIVRASTEDKDYTAQMMAKKVCQKLDLGTSFGY